MWTKTADEKPEEKEPIERKITPGKEPLKDVDIGFKVMVEDILERGFSEADIEALFHDTDALFNLREMLDDSYRSWLDNLDQYDFLKA